MGNNNNNDDSSSAESTTNHHPLSSQLQVSYPFSTDSLLYDTYRNPWGQIRIGKMLEDLDALAGNIAFFHVQRNRLDNHHNDTSFPVIVTASVDRIRLRRQPLVGSDQFLTGQVTYV